AMGHLPHAGAGRRPGGPSHTDEFSLVPPTERHQAGWPGLRYSEAPALRWPGASEYLSPGHPTPFSANGTLSPLRAIKRRDKFLPGRHVPVAGDVRLVTIIQVGFCLAALLGDDFFLVSLDWLLGRFLDHLVVGRLFPAGFLVPAATASPAARRLR